MAMRRGNAQTAVGRSGDQSADGGMIAPRLTRVLDPSLELVRVFPKVVE